MRDLELILTGAAPEAAARTLAAALDDAGLTLTPRPLPAAAPGHKAVDPVAVAGLILAIPGAVLTVLDIADRIAKRRRAKALVEAAARIRIEHRVEVLTVTLDGNRPLADLDPDALLELVGRD
ncbi:hypothetical protein [uncultured Thiodictyon sp.]|uniref:hypothetical protein n=1 Tax=uncultured Thiodictyon sp. TaxID=1846217 RepID=UPI0025DD8609|nr:hypothetical protein [uncultured Thiodictyon sp.]